jgi:NADPH:quinone reductase
VRSGAHVTGVVSRVERAALVRELGEHEVVVGVDAAQGRFKLVLESTEGPSLGKAVRLLEPLRAATASAKPRCRPSSMPHNSPTTNRSEVIYNSHKPPDPKTVRGHCPSDQIETCTLDLLLTLVAEGSLKPRIPVERSWKEIAPIAEQLRDRRIDGKAVLRVED